MKNILGLLFIFVFFSQSHSQNLYFPPDNGSWDAVSPSSLNWCNDSLDSLKQFLSDKNTKAFIILYRGKIVVEWYFDQFNQDSLWYWASAGKSLTSMLVGIAQGEGYFKITDTTAQYLGKGWTSCDDSAEEKITILNQLTMTTGLDDGVSDIYCTSDSCLKCLVEPGTRWAYHNAPYSLLEDVMENATGMNINKFYKTNIGDKIGAKGLYVKLGYNNVFFSTARAMARYGLLVLAKGTWNGTRVLSDTIYFKNMVSRSQELNKSYGYLWWLNGQGEYMLPGLHLKFKHDLIPDAPNDLFAALGKNDQKIYVVPSRELVVIRMGNKAEASLLALSDFDNDLWKKISALECKTTNMNENIRIKVRLYPNPVKKDLYINSNENVENLSLYNLNGQKIKISTRKSSISVEELPASLYFLKVTLENGNMKMFKIMKN